MSPLDPLFIAACLGTGVLAGTAAGLLGVGGGLIIVPVLAELLPRAGLDPGIVMQTAVGTSLASIVVTGLASARAHHRRGAVRLELLRGLVPGMVLGAVAASLIAETLSGDALRMAYGAFAAVVAVEMLIGIAPRGGRRLPGAAGLTGVGGGIGLISALVGVGGGTLTVPFLAWCRVPMQHAVGTAAATGPPIALAGAAGLLVLGWSDPRLPAAASGYLLWPALAAILAGTVPAVRLGAHLAHTLPADRLRRLFGVFLALVSVRMWMA